MHDQVIDWVAQFRTTDDLSVLDIGGRDLNGSTRMLFPNAKPYHVLDILPGPNVDFVADAAQEATARWLSGNQYDLVVTTETFEHAKDWPGIIRTAWEVLRPGGWLVFTCAGPGRPTHSGVAARWELDPGEWYANVSAQEIRAVLEEQGWTEIETHQRGLDTQGKAVKPVRTEGPAEVLLTVALSRTAPGPDTAGNA